MNTGGMARREWAVGSGTAGPGKTPRQDGEAGFDPKSTLLAGEGVHPAISRVWVSFLGKEGRKW